MHNYLLYLYNQYCAAEGKEFIEYNILDDYGFLDWLSKLRKNTDMFGEYLMNLNVELGRDRSIELGKGRYDSLGKDYSTIVSPFAMTMGLKNTKLTMNPTEAFIIVNSRRFKIPSGTTIYTQNPFEKYDIKNIIHMHNIGMGICLGFYGDLRDEDRKLKLEILKSVYQSLDDDVEYSYDTDQDNYYALVRSSRLVLRKRLTR